jgi:hypothetical protein
MDAPMSEGLVTLNAEGKRYTASFRIERGVITVTSGSVSNRVGLRDVISPQSTARTILRAMVREGRAADWVSPPDAEIHEERLRRTLVRHHRAWRTHLGYWQGLRG